MTDNIIYTGTSDNLYVDLGFEDADDLLLKSKIVSEISAIIREKNITQAIAAKLLGLPQPKISALLRGNFEGFTIDRLIRLSNKLGIRVHIQFDRESAAEDKKRLSA